MNYCIITGTNRPDSNSARIAKLYNNMLLTKDIEASLIDLQHLPTDFIFSNSFGNKNLAFEPFQEKILKAQKFIFVLPEYNGSFPGVLKAFIDACQFPDSFSGKKCCLAGLSSGQFGNIRGLEHFTGIANYVKMDVLHVKMYFPKIESCLNAEGNITQEFLLNSMEGQIDAFMTF